MEATEREREATRRDNTHFLCQHTVVVNGNKDHDDGRAELEERETLCEKLSSMRVVHLIYVTDDGRKRWFALNKLSLT